jgi:transglycosylase-like protein with SLT domain
MWRGILRILSTLFFVITGLLGKMDAASADIRVYRDSKGVLHITNNPGQTTPGRKGSKTGQTTRASFSGRLIDVKKEMAERNAPGPFVHDPKTRAAIHVYRDKQGTLLFTNVPNRAGHHPFLLLHSYSRRLGGKDSVAFDQLIRAACHRYGVEFALVKAVIKAESAFNPEALSHAGARGLMQLMPATAAMHGVDDIHAPGDNIDGGVRHLRLLLDQFDWDVPLALAAYNAGAGAVARYNGIPPYEETQTYVRRVLHYRDSYRERSGLQQPVA